MLKTIIELIKEDVPKSILKYNQSLNFIDRDFILKGDSDTLIKRINKISNACGKYSFNCVTKNVEFEYLGVLEGHKYPPYEFNEKYVGSIWTTTNSISGRLLIESPGYGYTNFPYDNYYQFRATEYGEFEFIKNLISLDKLIEKICLSTDSYKIINSITNKYLLDAINNNIGKHKFKTALEMAKLGF